MRDPTQVISKTVRVSGQRPRAPPISLIGTTRTERTGRTFEGAAQHSTIDNYRLPPLRTVDPSSNPVSSPRAGTRGFSTAGANLLLWKTHPESPDTILIPLTTPTIVNSVEKLSRMIRLHDCLAFFYLVSGIKEVDVALQTLGGKRKEPAPARSIPSEGPGPRGGM